MKVSPDFPAQLKQARKRKKFTQEYTAELLDISTRWIQYLESGNRTPGKKLMDKIYHLFPDFPKQ